MTKSNESNGEYLSAAQVYQRFGGVSHMWIVRKTRDEGFPAAIKFGGRLRFFRLSEIIAWEMRMITGGTKKAGPKRRAA